MAGAATRTPTARPSTFGNLRYGVRIFGRAAYAADYTNFGFKPLEY